MARNPVIAHRHLALIVCDSAASLAELLTQIDLTEIPHQRYGDRAIALPSPYVDDIHETLRDGGTYPRVVGEIHEATVPLETEQDQEEDA